MLMVDTKHRADRISIRGLLTVRGGERESQRALIPPASPSILEGGGVSFGVGKGGEEWGRGEAEFPWCW